MTDVTHEEYREIKQDQRLRRLEYMISQLHENHLELRRNFIAALASQQAFMEQLAEKGLLDAERWRRDKIRHIQQLEQEAARKDEEAIQEKQELMARFPCVEWLRTFGQPDSATSPTSAPKQELEPGNPPSHLAVVKVVNAWCEQKRLEPIKWGDHYIRLLCVSGRPFADVQQLLRQTGDLVLTVCGHLLARDPNYTMRENDVDMPHLVSLDRRLEPEVIYGVFRRDAGGQ